MFITIIANDSEETQEEQSGSEDLETPIKKRSLAKLKNQLPEIKKPTIKLVDDFKQIDLEYLAENLDEEYTIKKKKKGEEIDAQQLMNCNLSTLPKNLQITAEDVPPKEVADTSKKMVLGDKKSSGFSFLTQLEN